MSKEGKRRGRTDRALPLISQMAKLWHMKLAKYLSHHGISYTEFARRIGTDHPRTVERYAKGQRVPSGRMMAAIVAATAGAVQPADLVAPDVSEAADRPARRAA
jgi:transcriptional regulator with XRE-family HTH domain